MKSTLTRAGLLLAILFSIILPKFEPVTGQEAEPDYEIAVAFHDIYLIAGRGDDRVAYEDFVQLSNIDPGPSRNPSWSPDGSKVAFEALVWKSDDSDDTTAIFIQDLISGEVQTLLKRDEAAFHNPVWSPDGDRLAYVSDQDGNWEIYTISVDGTDPERLTENDSVDGLRGIAWSPDGNHIAFVSTRENRFNISVMSINKPSEETAEQNVINLNLEMSDCIALEEYFDVSWSVSDWIAVIVRCGSADIFAVNMAGFEETTQLSFVNLTADVPDDIWITEEGLDWSPDGTMITFIGIPYPPLEEPYLGYPNQFELFTLTVDMANGSFTLDQRTSNPEFEIVYFDPAWRPFISE